MRISDWSSDVCSSDLAGNPVPFGVIQALGHVAADVAGRDRQTVELAHRVVLDPLHPVAQTADRRVVRERSEEHTSELQSLMRISYAVFCLKKKKRHNKEQLYTHMNIDNCKKPKDY